MKDVVKLKHEMYYSEAAIIKGKIHLFGVWGSHSNKLRDNIIIDIGMMREEEGNR